MEKLLIKQYHIKKDAYQGIYVFLVNSNFKEEDFPKQKNCSVPLVWMIFPEVVKEHLKLCKNIDHLCAYEFTRFKEETRSRVEQLLKITEPCTVQLMILKIETFIKEAITYFNHCPNS